MALKLDISKAYDKVEWSFFRHTMKRLDFSNKWINLVMDYITTSSFSVIINKATKGLIRSQRGLRQGCPLSPYLFLIYAEVFSNMLMQAEEKRLIHGLKFDRNLTDSHLLFTSDSLTFTKVSIEDCRHLKKFLIAIQQLWDSSLIEKSSMFFNGKVSKE